MKEPFSFPVYDYPITGDEPLPNTSDSSDDSSQYLFKTFIVGGITPVPKPVESPSFISDMGTVLASPIKAVGGGISSAVEYVKGGLTSTIEGIKTTTRNTFLYIIGGVALIGIIGIVLLGAGSRFMGKVQGD